MKSIKFYFVNSFTSVIDAFLFRIVYDRESGKPKGYGFCEYQDTETAKSAMRNLNDYDFHGRSLRVGHAAGETSNAEKGALGPYLLTFLLLEFSKNFVES